MAQQQAPTFIDIFKQGFPEYGNLSNAQIATNINNSLSNNPNQFISVFKHRFPSYANLSNGKITKNITNSLNSLKNQGLLSTGDQAKDLGIKNPFDVTETGKVGETTPGGNPILKGIANFFTSGLQVIAENVGASMAAPENMQQYTDALQQHTDISSSILKSIQQKRKLGQDTSTLEKALQEQATTTPKISDFLDQTTLRRVNETMEQNAEELAGQLLSAGLDVATILPGAGEAVKGAEAATEGMSKGEKLLQLLKTPIIQGSDKGLIAKGIDTATEKGVSLGSKIATGAKVGAGFGAVAGAAGGLSKEQTAGQIAGDTAIGSAVGAGTGAATELAGGALSNVVRGRNIFGTLARAPEKLTGEDGALLKVPEAKQMILDSQKAIKANIANPDLPSPTKSLGSNILSKILTDADTQLDAIGQKMGKALDNVGSSTENTSIQSVYEDYQDSITKGVKGLTGSQREDFKLFNHDMQGLNYLDKNGKLTINDLDKFTRDWQKLYRKYQDTPLGDIINSKVHDINEIVKNAADKAEEKAGIVGHPYRESNNEYAQLVENINDAYKDAGKQRKYSGIFDNADSIIKKAGTPDSNEAFRNLANQTGNPLGQPASLINTVQQIYAGEKPDDYLKTLQIGFSLKMTAIRTLKNLLLKSEGDPDAIVQKMIQFIDDQSSKTK